MGTNSYLLIVSRAVKLCALITSIWAVFVTVHVFQGQETPVWGLLKSLLAMCISCLLIIVTRGIDHLVGELADSPRKGLRATSTGMISVVDLIMIERFRTAMATSAILVCAIIVTSVSAEDNSSTTSTVFFLALIACVLANSLVSRFRVSRGVYGTSEAEAREVIAFILANAKPSDFGDGGKRLPLLSASYADHLDSDHDPSNTPASDAIQTS